MTAQFIAFLVWFFQRNINLVLSNDAALQCAIRDKCTDCPFVQRTSYL